jgi:molybdenum cofactor biosynthesis enzyme
LDKLKVEHNIVHQEIQELEIETEANTTRREAAESIIQLKKKEIDDIEMSKKNTEKSEYKKIQSELHYQRS